MRFCVCRRRHASGLWRLAGGCVVVGGTSSLPALPCARTQFRRPTGDSGAGRRTRFFLLAGSRKALRGEILRVGPVGGASRGAGCGSFFPRRPQKNDPLGGFGGFRGLSRLGLGTGGNPAAAATIIILTTPVDAGHRLRKPPNRPDTVSHLASVRHTTVSMTNPADRVEISHRFNVSLLPLPPRAPELNGQKTSGSSCGRIGCQTGSSNPSTVDHCCYAWNTLIDQPLKIMSVVRRDCAAVGHSI